MIEVDDITVKRGTATILEGYTFDTSNAKVLAILGRNGVGKTTLLRAIIGVTKPTMGAIRLQGRIGFVPQIFEVAFAYSVIDIALMGRVRHIGLFNAPKTRDYEVVRHFFALLGISHLEKRPFNALSGGQRQLVMIAQALSSECEILILDEPCSALDYRNQDVVLNVIHSLNQGHGITVVFSTHVPQHAIEVADTVLLMHGKSEFNYGATQEILTESHLFRLYGMPIGRADFVKEVRHTYAPLYNTNKKL